MNIYEFMSGSPWLTFFLAIIVIGPLLAWPFILAKRWIRHRDIAAHGWPPAHCDADGDTKPGS